MRASIISSVVALASVASALPHLSRRQAKTQTVMVGMGGNLTFTPSNLQAQAGDMIQFVFLPKNHTVTMTSLESPCAPMNTTGGTEQFDSNYQAVAANAAEVPTQTLMVTATGPIYFACLQNGHCAKGMVGTINAPAEGAGSFADFQTKAKASAPAARKRQAVAADPAQVDAQSVVEALSAAPMSAVQLAQINDGGAARGSSDRRRQTGNTGTTDMQSLTEALSAAPMSAAQVAQINSGGASRGSSDRRRQTGNTGTTDMQSLAEALAAAPMPAAQVAQINSGGSARGSSDRRRQTGNTGTTDMQSLTEALSAAPMPAAQVAQINSGGASRGSSD